MIITHTDSKGNRLVVTFKGRVDASQAEKLYAKLQKIFPKLRKGFSVFVDMSALENMDIRARVFIERIMDLFDTKGVSKVIRIIPDPGRDIGFNIMSKFHYSPGVVIHTYNSYQEALDKEPV